MVGWDCCVAAAFHWTHRIDATAGRRKRGEASRSDRELRGQTKHNQVAYPFMDAVFFETTTFSRLRPGYLDDDGYRALQIHILASPESGDLMPGTGGFRKLRWHDERRGKGKRGGLRVIYYWLINDRRIWMFSIYDKDEVSNLTADQQRQLKAAIDAELRKRGKR